MPKRNSPIVLGNVTTVPVKQNVKTIIIDKIAAWIVDDILADEAKAKAQAKQTVTPS